MSLHALKETLKPCSSLPSSSVSTDSTSSSKPSLSQEFGLGNPRKPPKSSLSQQLLRLQGSFSSEERPSHVRAKEDRAGFKGEDGEGEEEEEEEKVRVVFGRPKSASFQFDHTGPFEPLLLSSEGEVPVIQVPSSINCRLLEHQREGVKFLYGLYKNNHGGVLGDDMGLGKTIQTIAFLAAIFGKDAESESLKGSKEGQLQKKGPVLIICPTSVIHNWESEFSKWAAFAVSMYHGSLGTREHFRDFYDEPLKHGQRSTAPEKFVQIADKRKQHLVGVLRKYMLRRTKDETIGHLMMVVEAHLVKLNVARGLYQTGSFGLTFTGITPRVVIHVHFALSFLA